MKSIENKSVELFWGYLYPFCSTFFTFFTLFSIFISLFTRATKNTSALVDFVNMLRPWQLINEIVKTFGKIVEKFKFLTDNAMKLMNLMKLMNTKDVELFKFLTRNTNTNKPLPGGGGAP